MYRGLIGASNHADLVTMVDSLHHHVHNATPDSDWRFFNGRGWVRFYPDPDLNDFIKQNNIPVEEAVKLLSAHFETPNKD